ncbi:outer membrane protein [Sphingomonas sp. MMS24-J45]|uniref:outer membrane protein n=1 Tax=Sphingomonas sp. MMS24-J45 TaxID=3238806 RepID=UPI003850AF71
MPKGLFPSLTLLSFAISVPAHAQSDQATQVDTGPYVGLSGGVSLPNRSNNRGTFKSDVPATSDFPAISSGTPISWRTRFDAGFNIAGQFGYRFENGFRPEVEVAYSEFGVRDHSSLAVGGNTIDGLDSAVLTQGSASITNPTVGAVLSTDPSRIKNLAVFGNLYYDFNRTGRLQPYVGAGLGAQRIDIKYAPSGVTVADADKTRFAYQLMGGVTYKITPSVDLFGQYNYRATSARANVDLSLLPATLGVQSRQSIISTGVRIHFGKTR